ncbi:MAG: aminopeptidase [Chloroflexi bacterium]|nr:aminopeptidase [Chloroflexota bacterium]
MNWPEKERLVDGVVNMLKVNMGLKPGESLLVLTDIPRVQDWTTLPPDVLGDMLDRAMLARLVADIARDHFPQCSVTYLPFFATGGHGAEPDPDTAARMREPQVLIALTTYSLSHTNAREAATQAGVRIASMPGFEAHMLEPGGPMAVDYRQIARDCRVFADALTAAKEVVVRTPYGTDLRFSLEGRPGQVDDGLYGDDPKTWGNLPAGEAFAVPVEGTGEGVLVARAGWYPRLTEDMRFVFERGEVVEITGGGEVGEMFRELLRIGDDDPVYRARRNLAEIGIGTNPNARKPDNVLEAEKIKGTVHIAIGDNIHMGGQVEADLHEDFVQPDVTLLLDGRPVIVDGRWQV